VIGFEHKDDAQRFLDAMHDRLGEFALSWTQARPHRGDRRET